MRVKSQTQIRQPEGVFDPGDVFDLRDALAEQWIKNGWVKPLRLPKPPPPPPVVVAAEPEPVEITEPEAVEDVELAVVEGAPERAVSRRGRRRRIRKYDSE